DGPGRAGALPGRVRDVASGLVPTDVQPDEGHPGGGPADARPGRRLPGRAAAPADECRAAEIDRRRLGRQAGRDARNDLCAAGADGDAGCGPLALPGDGRRLALRPRRGPSADRPDAAASRTADDAGAFTRDLMYEGETP